MESSVNDIIIFNLFVIFLFKASHKFYPVDVKPTAKRNKNEPIDGENCDAININN